MNNSKSSLRNRTDESKVRKRHNNRKQNSEVDKSLDLLKEKKKNEREKNHNFPGEYKSKFQDNDFSNYYVHTGKSPISQIRNIVNPMDGYPKLQTLHKLKEAQIRKHAMKPFGCKVSSNKIIPTLRSWINDYGLQFDVIMIGALVENQFIQPLLQQIPLHRLCNKPGFLFIWATTQKIQELTKFLNSDMCNKKFRRSEELVFVTVERDSPYHPGDAGDGDMLFVKHQWHCWMCITGTVRRSTDNHLIHCNVDTDLQIEGKDESKEFSGAVPDSIYKVAENFSNSNRRLHIIPSRVGYNHSVRLRPGWVIMSPDILIDNFDPLAYEQELYAKSMVVYKNVNNTQKAQFFVPQTSEIEELRPKSPTHLKN